MSEKELKPSSHHHFGPSSIDMYDKCPLAYHLGKDLESLSTEASIAGTGYHSDIANLINSFLDGNGCMTKRPSEEMIEQVREEQAIPISTAFTRFIKCIDNMFGTEEWEPFIVDIEQKLTLSLENNHHEEIFTDEPIFGTSDIVCVFKEKILVIDWKFGQNEPPKATDSLQTAAYAVASSDKYNRKNVTAIIINPFYQFDYVMDSFTFDEEGIEVARDIIWDVANRCVNGPWIPAMGKHCTYCRANQHGVCTSIKKEIVNTYNSFPSTTEEISISLEAMDDKELAGWKVKTDLLKTICTSVDDEIKKRCLASVTGSCGGYMVKERSGGKKIDDVCQAFKVASELLSPSEYLSACTLSVSKLKNIWASVGKESGTFKTKKAAMEDFDMTFEQYMTDKDPVYMIKKIQ